MNTVTPANLNMDRMRRYLALPLTLALAGVLLGVLFAALSPRTAGAAPATPYSCTEAQLDLALATGGLADFICPPNTTVTVSARKTVSRDVTLEGNNNLILSGNNLTGVFTVATGVHLTLLNLTVRDARNIGNDGGGVYNNGVLAVTHSHFISNSAYLGAAVFNAPGATASISGSSVESNVAGQGGAVWNGSDDISNQVGATLTVVNSTFLNNTFVQGAAIFNQAGSVSVSGSIFDNNLANTGGAIMNESTLHVDTSQFFSNQARIFGLAQQAQAPGPDVPAGGGPPFGIGGAIYSGPTAVSIIASSSFTDNFSMSGGGAVFFGVLPPAGVFSTTSRPSITSSLFADNCSGGPGGALGTSMTATVSDSIFSANFADSSSTPCPSLASNQARTGAPAGSQASGPAILFNLAGQGGAVFNSGSLDVTGSSFLANETNLTNTGGGGAISNYSGSGLTILNIWNGTFTGNVAQEDGGAIYSAGNTTVGIYASDFTNNTATDDAGGAVANQGALTVNNSSFTGNASKAHNGILGGGGAIFSGQVLVANGASQTNQPAGAAAPQGFFLSSLTLDHGRFISNAAAYEGGAIDASNAKITASSFTSNTSQYGGAIDVLGNSFTISGSAFIGNSAITTTLGGAQQGGAIDTNGNDVSIQNSTFYTNRAQGSATGGAINQDGGTVAITNSTFLSNTADTPGNGGALAHAGTIVLHNTLLAFNSSENCDSAVTLSGANLEFPGTTCGGASVQANPLALAPANNGGLTLTSALLAGSPARDTGDNSGCPSTDQRGAHRPVGAQCDIGAFEFGGSVPWLWLPFVHN